MNTPISECKYDDRPWYRQGWPWFIMSFPAASVLLGLSMLYLAHQTNNSLVVDDYYKQGKAISQHAARDQLARALRLSAMISAMDGGIRVQLKQAESAQQSINYPDSLKLQWVHVTQSSRDGGVLLRHYGSGRYFASAAMLPVSGKWRMHVEPADSQFENNALRWRLISNRVDATSEISVDYRS